MLAVGIYVAIRSPSVLYISLVFILTVALLFMTFVRDQAHFSSAGSGSVECRIWALTGVRNYRYGGLTEARSIIVTDIGASDSGKSMKQFLLFSDGHRIPLPEGEEVSSRIAGWFESVYGIRLSTIRE